jgi:hypothetical protein
MDIARLYSCDYRTGATCAVHAALDGGIEERAVLNRRGPRVIHRIAPAAEQQCRWRVTIATDESAERVT